MTVTDRYEKRGLVCCMSIVIIGGEPRLVLSRMLLHMNTCSLNGSLLAPGARFISRLLRMHTLTQLI